MQTQTQTKPSALNVKGLEDIIYLLRESEKKGGATSAKNAYIEGKKQLEKLTYNRI
ncbi:MAG: hypothetical protein Q9M94_00625 [Candidatus Gracilibacteria bacterium]|nr:hypothetical protein [Candidatus Gracilibacteria bacterium]MDQ7022200.1 hypothetical protein [Candidatus Gracilibacteria bacterium]